MLRAVIADVLGIANITDIVDVADIVNIWILQWRQVGAYKVLPGCQPSIRSPIHRHQNDSQGSQYQQ